MGRPAKGRPVGHHRPLLDVRLDVRLLQVEHVLAASGRVATAHSRGGQGQVGGQLLLDRAEHGLAASASHARRHASRRAGHMEGVGVLAILRVAQSVLDNALETVLELLGARGLAYETLCVRLVGLSALGRPAVRVGVGRQHQLVGRRAWRGLVGWWLRRTLDTAKITISEQLYLKIW